MSQITESKVSKNKKAFLHIMDILKNTDEDHPITANQICEILDRDYGLQLERRSVGRDLRLLMETGADMVFCQDNKLGCYMASHQFEDWELKVLVDAVAQAKFLRTSVSDNLIERLLETTSEYKKSAITDATVDRVHSKTKNKLTQVNIDVLLEAIDRGKKVSFQYCFLDENLDLVPRKEGREYLVNPYQLMWSNDIYYLICNYEGYKNLSYYRLDKIKGATILDDQEIKSPDQLLGADYQSIIKDFVGGSIHNFGGDKKILLKLEIDSSKIDYMYDEFGDNIIRIDKAGASSGSDSGSGSKTQAGASSGSGSGSKAQAGADSKVVVTIKTSENQGLYYLLLQFGETVKVLEPAQVRDKYVDTLHEILSKY